MRRCLLHILLVVSLFGLAGGLASAQNTRRQENRKAQLEKEIAILNRQLQENSRSSSNALSNLNLIRRKITARQALIEESNREIHALEDSIRVREREIARLQARHDTLSRYYARLVRSAYKNRDSRLWYMYILSSDSMGQAFRRFGYLRSFSREMSAQAVRIRETKAALEEEQQQLAVLKDEAQTLKEERVSAVSALRTEENQSADLVAQLNRDRKQFQQQLEKKNREVEALNREIAEIIRKATAGTSSAGSGAAKGGKAATTTVDAKLSNEFASNKGKLPWPVDGTVVESFGQHAHPVYKNVQMPFNNGVTIAVGRGASVKAVFDGTVGQVVVMAGYGQCVMVQHGSYFTLYCKLKTVAVRSGDKVKTGQVIGTVDTINGEDQLHFELWKERTPQNPESWLK